MTPPKFNARSRRLGGEFRRRGHRAPQQRRLFLLADLASALMNCRQLAEDYRDRAPVIVGVSAGSRRPYHPLRRWCCMPAAAARSAPNCCSFQSSSSSSLPLPLCRCPAHRRLHSLQQGLPVPRPLSDAQRRHAVHERPSARDAAGARGAAARVHSGVVLRQRHQDQRARVRDGHGRQRAGAACAAGEH